MLGVCFQHLAVPLTGLLPLVVIKEHVSGFQTCGEVFGPAPDSLLEGRQCSGDIPHLAADQGFGNVSVPTGTLLDKLLGLLQGLRETARFAQQSDSRHLGDVRQVTGKLPTPH